MPTRSIQVKLVVPRGDEGRPLRQSLRATHDAVNAATKFYEQCLLLMRGESYVTADGEVGEAAVLDELRKIIGEAKVRNGGEDDGLWWGWEGLGSFWYIGRDVEGFFSCSPPYQHPISAPCNSGVWFL